MQFDKTKHSSKYQSSLSYALQFTESDLTANQQGIISDPQATRLRMKLILGGGLFAVTVVLSGIAFAFITTIYIFDTLRRTDFSSHIFSIGLFILVAAVFWFSTIRHYFKRFQCIYYDIQERQIASIEGRVHIDFSIGKNGTSYHSTVNEERFEIDKQTFLAFKNDDPYRLYYAPRSKVLLSAEWLRDDPFLPE